VINSLLLKNCLLYNSSDKTNLTDIFIEDSKISFTGKLPEEKPSDNVIDASGRIVSPGLIDVHIQGAGGADILDGTEEAVKTISKTLARLGTTSYLGTTVVKPSTNNKHLKAARELVNKNIDGATLLGFHIEGPFINPEKKGGLAEDGIYPSSKEKMYEILEITGNHLRMMTIAPELPGNLDIIRELVKNNVVAAFAHSTASYEETLTGFEAGINHVTHIFNAMNGLHHRNPGPITAIFENKTVSAQIISDGHHLHPTIVKLVYNNIGPERCICITDGIQAMGLPEGRFFYNEREYETKSGAARYLDGTLIGSAMSLLEIVLKFKEFTGCSLKEAIDSASLNPARLLKLNKGSLEKGKDADLIILNEDYSVFAAIVNGKIVYKEN
jgi:N-acetylglucosamine-6-phosphate deacetylase